MQRIRMIGCNTQIGKASACCINTKEYNLNYKILIDDLISTLRFPKNKLRSLFNIKTFFK